MDNNNFHQKLLGGTVRDRRGNQREIVACWQLNNGVRCLVVGNYGESFLLDLPDIDWSLYVKES